MSRLQTGLRVAMLVCVQGFSTGITLAQGTPTVVREWKLAAPARHAIFDEVVQPGLLAPNWAHGFIIARSEKDSSDPADVNVVLYDRTGARTSEARVWLTGAVRVHVYDAIATDQGAVIASGYSVMADRTVVHFIARTDPGGKVTDVVNTKPFSPRSLSLSSDGTVWAMGLDPDRDDRHEDYRLVRHYSFDQGLLGAYLARNSFPRSTNPAALSATSAISGSQATFLRSGGNTVWVYINLTGQVVEINPSTDSEARFQVDMASQGNVNVRGFAVTDDGHLFAGLSEFRNGPTELYELRPNRSTMHAQWVAVDDGATTAGGAAALAPGSFVQLWGADGRALVIERAGEDGLSWVPVTRAAAQLP